MPIMHYAELIAHSFYDTLRLGKGQVLDQFVLFQQTVGDVGKFGDTNMNAPGRLLPGECFVGRRLWIDLLYADATDLSLLKSDCIVTLKCDSKIYSSLPASVLVLESTLSRIIKIIEKKKLPPGKPFWEVTNRLQLGLLVEPIAIQDTTSFSVHVTTRNPITLTDKLAARIFWEGHLRRPVQ